MTNLPPDLATLRAHAIEARDGALIGGVRAEPHIFVTVHWQTMLAVLDSTDQPSINTAHTLGAIERTAGELNHAIAHHHERAELIALSGRLIRQLHALTERTAA